MSGRGGRRPGAGAPRGNKNRLIHARYARDQRLRHALAKLPEDVRDFLLPLIRDGAAAAERRLAWLDPQAANVVPFHTASSSSSQEQSNRLTGLALRMAAHGFIGAQGFLRQHLAHLPDIAAVVDGFDAHPDGVYTRLESAGATLNHTIHLTIAQGYGARLYCPSCRWNTHAQGKEQTS